MALALPFRGVERRTAWLRGTLLLASFLGLLASAPLWLNSRTFPLLPITPGFPILPSPWDKLFFAAMLLALFLSCRFYRVGVIFFLVAGLFAFCEDQNRGQPWFYMYWVLLLLSLTPGQGAIAACRCAMSVAYLWSGIQKCHPKFFQVVPAWFVAPASHWHLPSVVIMLLRWAVATAPFVELGIGLALWFPRLRLAAIGAAVVLHVSALLFLGPLGYNYDWVVWPWNIAMVALLFVLFPRAASVSIKQSLAQIRRSKPALAILTLYSLLPILSYFGWWDSYFSFTLFAENQSKADIFVTEAFRERLPPEIREYVHKLRQSYDPRIQGPFVFDFQTWGFRELRAPPLFEPRSYRSIFGFLRRYSKDPDDLRMIVAPRAGPILFYQGDRQWVLTPAR